MNDSVERAVAAYLGANEIDWEKLKPVMYFVVLWNRLEAKCGCHITLDKLQEKSQQVAEMQGFDLSLYQPQIKYFRERYSNQPDLLQALFRLATRRENEAREKVRRLLSGEDLTPGECLEAALVIPYRIRNNLFHGNKSTHDLYDQTSLFDNVNHVLCQFHSDLR